MHPGQELHAQHDASRRLSSKSISALLTRLNSSTRAATDGIPLNFAFTGKGNDSGPDGLVDIVTAGACGLKLCVPPPFLVAFRSPAALLISRSPSVAVMRTGPLRRATSTAA